MDNKTYSIPLRIRRVTYEDAYVSVPLTSAVIKENGDSSFGIDFDKFTAEAFKLGEDPGVEWQIENVAIESHPLQVQAPEGRKSFHPDIDISEFLQGLDFGQRT